MLNKKTESVKTSVNSSVDYSRIGACKNPSIDHTPRVAIPAAACLWIDDKASKERTDEFYGVLLTRNIIKAPHTAENLKVWYNSFGQFQGAFDKLTRAKKDIKPRFYNIFLQLSAYMIESGWSSIESVEKVVSQELNLLGNANDDDVKQFAENRANEIKRFLKGLSHKILILCSGPDPEMTPAPAAVVAADDRDDIMKEYLTKYDFKKADAVPNMLLDSINKGCPLWSFKWFGFAELPRRYFNGACFSMNNMILLAFHGGYYVSLTEARRILGDKATPKEGAIARAVLRPVFKGARNLRKSDLDALRNCEEIDDDTRQRRPDFYMVERVYDQTAFDGLELKKEKELPQNENERNAQAENIFRVFCKANNIGFLETEGNGQAVTQIRTNGLGKVESITINMPSISQFKNATAYYSVLFHEATHAANAVNGCQLTKKREELSAEIGSCIVLNTLGFDPAEYIDDSAHYVQRFKDCANEKNAIKKAWKYAQASALLILDSYINETEEEEAPAPAPKQEPKQEEAPAPVEPDDDNNARKEAVKELLESLDSFNAAIAYAATTGGIVHLQKAEEAKKEVESLIERADNLNTLDSKTLAYFETLCKNIAIVAIKNNLARLIDDTSRNWDQYQRAALQTLREIETSETVQKNDKLQWRFTDAFSSVVESKTSDDVRTILKNLVNAI